MDSIFIGPRRCLGMDHGPRSPCPGPHGPLPRPVGVDDIPALATSILWRWHKLRASALVTNSRHEIIFQFNENLNVSECVRARQLTNAKSDSRPAKN